MNLTPMIKQYTAPKNVQINTWPDAKNERRLRQYGVKHDLTTNKAVSAALRALTDGFEGS